MLYLYINHAITVLPALNMGVLLQSEESGSQDEVK